jgi:glycine cleavage system aminomethyltransferase T
VTTELGALNITGPKTRRLLEGASGEEMPSDAFPYMSWRRLPIGAVMTRALRVSYSGELGWELHMPIEMLRQAYLLLAEAGEALGLTDVGYRALGSLGLEKGYGEPGTDLTLDFTPLEAGLGRFVALDKGPFIGRDALIEQQAEGVSRHRACLLLDPDVEAMPWGMEPVLQHGELVGHTVRGGYGHRIGRSIAYAYLPTDVMDGGDGLEVELIGHPYPAQISRRAPYDPDDRRREPTDTPGNGRT